MWMAFEAEVLRCSGVLRLLRQADGQLLGQRPFGWLLSGGSRVMQLIDVPVQQEEKKSGWGRGVP